MLSPVIKNIVYLVVRSEFLDVRCLGHDVKKLRLNIKPNSKKEIVKSMT